MNEATPAVEQAPAKEAEVVAFDHKAEEQAAQHNPNGDHEFVQTPDDHGTNDEKITVH